MEGKKSINNNPEANELAVIEAVFFVSSFGSIKEESELDDAALEETLIALLQKGYIDQMSFDDKLKDYLVKDEYDLKHVPDYYYVATKNGLLKSNGRAG